MVTVDELDRRLIGLLRANGRASISGLAEQLRVARGTVQSRVDRLVSRGIIRRFTIEVADVGDRGAVRALCSIALTHAHTGSVARRLRELPAVLEINTTNGKWDLVVEISTTSLDELDATLAAVREIPVVASTETSILLRRL